MWIKYNVNTDGHNTSDCTVRAISVAVDQGWDQTYIDLCIQGYLMKRMPSLNEVWDEYLRSRGFTRHVIPNRCPQCYNVRDFCEDNQRGTFLLATGTHLVAVKDGNYIDTWDSGNAVPMFYYRRNQ